MIRGNGKVPTPPNVRQLLIRRLSGVAPGRCTLTLLITDTLADKKAQTITGSMDFVVVN